MADKRVEEICYWLRPKSAELGIVKTIYENIPEKRTPQPR